MKYLSRILYLSLGLIAYLFTFANELEARGLTIHAAELGIGKFHRKDNKVRPYGDDNIWKNYVLPDSAGTKTPLRIENADGSVTIFFSHLEELMREMVAVAHEKQEEISVFNLNAHGMPGAMWFPKDESTMKGASCNDWVQTARGSDDANYDQYYSAISKSQIMTFRLLSKLPSMTFMSPCTTGYSGWKKVAKRVPEIKMVFAQDAQVHLFSCLVGLGWAGRRFTSNIAQLLLKGENAKVQAAMNFGLGDWSMPEGMGFWDYLNDDQLAKDSERYPIDREDRAMMQKGQIRLAMKTESSWTVGIVPDLDFMFGNFDSLGLQNLKILEEPKLSAHQLKRANALVELIRAGKFDLKIPRTNERVGLNP